MSYNSESIADKISIITSWSREKEFCWRLKKAALRQRQWLLPPLFTRHVLKYANMMAKINANPLLSTLWLRIQVWVISTQPITRSVWIIKMFQWPHQCLSCLPWNIFSFKAFLLLPRSYLFREHTHTHTHLVSKCKCRLIPSRMCWPAPISSTCLNRSEMWFRLRHVSLCFWFRKEKPPAFANCYFSVLVLLQKVMKRNK